MSALQHYQWWIIHLLRRLKPLRLFIVLLVEYLIYSMMSLGSPKSVSSVASSHQVLQWSSFPLNPRYNRQPPNSRNQCDIEIRQQPLYLPREAYQKRQQWWSRVHERLKPTAILLHWKRTAELRLIVEHLVSLDGLFDEIIIWNNNPNVKLQPYDLPWVDSNVVSIRIFQDGNNYRDEAKYLACSKATNPVCYYQDDDWDTREYIQSLYLAFTRAPRSLHSVTDPYTLETNLEWSFRNEELNLHAGFSWIGCGSFFLKEHAVRFIDLMNELLDKEFRSIADVFFSLWMNQYPYQYAFAISQLTSDHAFSSEDGFNDLQTRAAVFAIRSMEKSLQGRMKRFSSFDITPVKEVRESWALCIRDECVFDTNAQNPTEGSLFLPKTATEYKRATRQNLPRMSETTILISTSEYAAIDGDYSTCWISDKLAEKDSYYGLQFTRPRPLKFIEIMFEHSHSLQETMVLEVSDDLMYWTGMETHTELNVTCNVARYTFRMSFHQYAAARFRVPKSSSNWSSERFSVCDIRIGWR